MENLIPSHIMANPKKNKITLLPKSIFGIRKEPSNALDPKIIAIAVPEIILFSDKLLPIRYRSVIT